MKGDTRRITLFIWFYSIFNVHDIYADDIINKIKDFKLKKFNIILFYHRNKFFFKIHLIRKETLKEKHLSKNPHHKFLFYNC